MKIIVITLFPQMLSGFLAESIVKKAQEKKLVEIEIVNLRDFANDAYQSVDDRPYGGGAGMVIKIEVLAKALEFCQAKFPVLHLQSKSRSKSQHSKIILTSPKGKVFNQQKAQELTQLKQLILIAGHYEGVDERIKDYIDEELSLGDFVMTGGEITAAAVVDALVRLLPGVLKKKEATAIESFFPVKVSELEKIIGPNKRLNQIKDKGIKTISLLEFPHYTRPRDYQGKKVPSVLLSGNAQKIYEWRIKKSWEQTVALRPDLLDKLLK